MPQEYETRSKGKKLRLNKQEIEKIASTLDTISGLLKNSKNMDNILKEFAKNPEETIALLGKINTLKSIISSSAENL